jgi:hypothetical protein
LIYTLLTPTLDPHSPTQAITPADLPAQSAHPINRVADPALPQPAQLSDPAVGKNLPANEDFNQESGSQRQLLGRTAVSSLAGEVTLQITSQQGDDEYSLPGFDLAPLQRAIKNDLGTYASKFAEVITALGTTNQTTLTLAQRIQSLPQYEAQIDKIEQKVDKAKDDANSALREVKNLTDALKTFSRVAEAVHNDASKIDDRLKAHLEAIDKKLDAREASLDSKFEAQNRKLEERFAKFTAEALSPKLLAFDETLKGGLKTFDTGIQGQIGTAINAFREDTLMPHMEWFDIVLRNGMTVFEEKLMGGVAVLGEATAKNLKHTTYSDANRMSKRLFFG